jgi:hypothetical protein
MSEKNYLPHEQRVIEEKSDLDEKINALGQFTETETLDNLSVQERVMLEAQYHAMCSYSAILALRIVGFNSK